MTSATQKSPLIDRKKCAYAFIDSNNLYQGLIKDIPKRNYKGWRLDFKKFRIYLANKYGVQKAFLFIGYIEENNRMYEKLKKDGYILIFKPTVPFLEEGTKKLKGNVDAELVLQAMIEYPNYDKAIIVAGDGDYKCLVQYLFEKNKLHSIFIPNQKQYSSLLLPFKKYMKYMNPLSKKLAYTKIKKSKKKGSVACSI